MKKSIEEKIYLIKLFDEYEELLPKKQKEYLKLSYDNDYSLAEISELFKVSRTAVSDAIKKAEKSLFTYEKLLKNVEYKESINMLLNEVLKFEISRELKEKIMNKIMEGGV